MVEQVIKRLILLIAGLAIGFVCGGLFALILAHTYQAIFGPLP